MKSNNKNYQKKKKKKTNSHHDLWIQRVIILEDVYETLLRDIAHVVMWT